MTSTVVPNYAIMLSIAFGMGSSMNVDMIVIAVHGGDTYISRLSSRIFENIR